MDVLFFAIPIALFISLIAVLAFVYQVRSGQFDDLETPPLRILFDDVEGQSDRKSTQPLPPDDDGDQPDESE